MGNWGISPNAEPKEKLKAEMADHLRGLNSVGEISYETYNGLFDFSMDLLDKMYELGSKEVIRKVLCHEEECVLNNQTSIEILEKMLKTDNLLFSKREAIKRAITVLKEQK